jgi:bacteriocin biosynthesis cyclodehydratase domain-containing protein
MSRSGSRRPRVALPFTILPSRDTVRLIAGEDFRYTLQGPGLDEWLPPLLASCDGRRDLVELLSLVPPPHRSSAPALVDRLYGERVLVDGPAIGAHPAVPHGLRVEGAGPLADLLRPDEAPATPALAVLCQDRLDYDAALGFNDRRLQSAGGPWIWATTGPMARAYVSPVFLPDAGPCLACLLGRFRGLSPAPELYDALEEHARNGRPIEAVPFPPEGVAIAAQLVRWKRALLMEKEPPPSLYRLHVVEAAALEVTSHRVFADPECAACGRRGA